MQVLKSIFLISLGLMSVLGAHLPKNFNTCSRKDADFDECLRSSIDDAVKKLNDGNKQLGIIPLEPLEIGMISVSRNPSSSVSIDQKFNNIKLHGLTHSNVTKATFDFNKYSLYAEVFTPEMRSEAEFEMTGQLLIFPINSKGPSNVTMTNLKSVHNLTCEKYQKKGKDYIRLTDYKITLMPEKIQYKFKDVLGGEVRALLNEQVDRTINENSISVFEEVRSATEESYGLIFREIANRIFTKVPFNEIFKD